MPNPDARWLTDDIGQIDLMFTGVPRAVAAYLLPTSDGLAVVDTGPTTVIEALFEGIRALGHDPANLRHLLATHIHLDHTGAAGTLMQRLPEARFYVHEIGAPHMFDPSNLLRSATRIYGDDMERLWGEFLPVPEDRTTVVRDGDTLDIGGRQLVVVYTPGHASHHVGFHESASRSVFAGDVGGIRIPPTNLPIPPTPPPDINVETWRTSIARIRDLAPERLLITHFGEVTNVTQHLDQLEANLDELVTLVADGMHAGLEREQIVGRMEAWVQARASATGHADIEAQFAINVPYGMATDGLMRYVRKRAEATDR